jgi:hypothetical protein
MPSSVMGSLRYRAVGQTPIYDQLRGERINADVPPNDIDSHRHSPLSRHCRGEDAPSAAALERPLGREIEGVAGHHRRGKAYPAAAGSAGDELGMVRADGPYAGGVAETGVRAAPRHARGAYHDDEQPLDYSSVSRSAPRHQLRHP